MFVSVRSVWKSIIRIGRGLPLIPVAIIMVFFMFSAFGEYIAPHEATAQVLLDRLKPPDWTGEGTKSHLLGTDELGRDQLSRLIVGARASCIVALATLFVGGILGGMIGLVSGYLGGRVDSFVMRVADGVLAFPIVLLAILLAITIGPGFTSTVAAVSIIIWSRFARVIRGEVLTIKEREYVKVAKAVGASPLRIMAKHIFPNILNTLVVLLSLQVGWVIITEAILSFLGAGIPPPTPTWGNMVADGRQYIESAWWVALPPGLAILLVVLAFNLLGDWLRDRLDPKLRQMQPV